MAIRVKALITCDSVEELQGDRFTFHGVFNKLVVRETPTRLQRGLFIVTMMEVNEPREYDCEMLLLDPDQKVISTPIDMNISMDQEGTNSVNYILELNMLPINKPGVFTICIRHNEQIIAWNDLNVIVKEGEE